MTCQEVNDYLDRSSLGDGAELPAMLRKHLQSCGCCRSLWEMLSRRPCPRQVPQQVRSRIEDQVLGSLEPVAPVAGVGKLTLSFFSIFGGVSALFVIWGASPGAPGIQSLPFAAFVAMAGLAGVLLSWTLSREMAPGEKRYVSPPVTLFLSSLGLFAAAVVVFPWTVGESFFVQSWSCFQHGALMSLPAAGLAVILLRRGAILTPGVVGAAAGLLAALVGVVGLHFSCTTQAAPHIALGHLGIVALGAGVGYLAGRLIP
jgi:hypothetical protein